MAVRVLHLSTFDTDSGAARGAYWLHKALGERSVVSSILVGRKSGSDPSVRPLRGSLAQLMMRVRMRLDRLPLRRYDKTDEAFWTLGWIPSGVDRQIRAFKPDIVHLHWIGSGFMAINELKKIGCPIVWTLRDMWPFTGGCHYTNGCDHYLGMCGRCPQLRSDRQDDLSRAIWLKKKAHWGDLDLWVVPISQWLSDCARGSALLRSFPIEVIPNGVNTRRFRPVDRSTARATLDIPSDARVVVYGAVGATSDPRKGYPQLLAAFRSLAQAGHGDKLRLIVFGSPKPTDAPNLGIETRFVGFIDDDIRLARLYSSADVAVVPSLEEAFGKTVIEAMACGVPVVAFDHGGPRDIIDHRVDGYLAEAFESDDLAAGIMWCLDNAGAQNELARRARAKVMTRFDIGAVAERYLSLYRRILSESPKPVSAPAGGAELRTVF